MAVPKMGNEQTTTGWTATFDEIKKNHDAAYGAIDEAIKLEEQEKPQEALNKYKTGIELIDAALGVQVSCPEEPDFTWEKACIMIQKMKKTRAEVLSRINTLSGSIQEPLQEQPPSYEEAMSSGAVSNTITYNDLAQALNQLKVDNTAPLDAEVVYVYDSVKLYFISPNGEVSSTLAPQTMKITLVESTRENAPRAILQIGDWFYPLIPGVSPCYRTDYGAFILPNVYAEIPGSSIGIILPPDADSSVYELLENILYGIVGHKAPEEELSEKISSGIVNGAWYLSQGLVKGAEKVGDLINKSTPNLIRKITPPQQPANVNPKVVRSLQMAENATGRAARITGYVADQVGLATMKLGRFLAPHIQKQGSRLLTTGFRMSQEDADNKMKGVLTVAAGAVEGFSTVYRGLESSASILGQSLKDNTIKVVQHKYGHTAGEVTGDAINTAGNVYQISQHARIIRPANLAKRTAKDAGKAVVTTYSSTNRPGTSRQTDHFMEPPKKPNLNLDLEKKPKE